MSEKAAFMDKMQDTLVKYLVPFATKLNNNKIITAMREGMMATMGLLITGAIFLLIATFPFPEGWAAYVTSNPVLAVILFTPYNLTMGIISVFIAFAIGLKLSEAYNLNPVVGGCNAAMVFLCSVGTEVTESGATVLNMSALGTSGMFSAMILSIFTIVIMRFCIEHNIGIKLPEAVPANVAGSFSAMIPSVLAALIVLVLTHAFGFNINAFMTNVFNPIFSAAGDNLFTALLFVVMSCLLWFVGVHPIVVETALIPSWTMMAADNTAALAAGTPIPYTYVQPFYFSLIFIGGMCCTLALNFLMLRAKSRTYRELGRIALPASIFNINEPLLFGMPIVMNPILTMGALAASVVTTLTSALAVSTGLVPLFCNPAAAVWNLPAPLAAALGTNSWQAAVLVVVNFAIQLLIWIPFFRMADAEMVAKEGAEAE